MSTVRANVWPIWISSAGRESLDHAHFEGMSVRSVVPTKFADCNLRVLVNGAIVEDLDAPIEPGDQVDIAVRPSGPFLPAFTGVLASLFATSAAAAQTAILLGFAGSFLSFLIGRSRGPRKKDDEESPSYGFNGPSNTRVEGLPKQVIYGESREPGQVIDSFTITRTSPPETDLYILIGFGEGPVYRIGDQTEDTDVAFPLSTEDGAHPIIRGVQVNGNNLENFNRVEAHVRLGTNAQKPIPGFQAVFTDYAVGAVLDQEQVASPGSGSIVNGLLNPDLDLTTIPFNSNATDAQALWDEFGFGFDLTNKADSYKIVIAFERGLYGISNSTGAVTNAGFQMLTRYMRLDDGGTPITTGGDNGDGWIYVFPRPIHVAHAQSAFTLEFEGTFIDPSTYTAPTLGKYLDCSAASSFSVSPVTASLAGVPAQFGNGATLQSFTIEGWFRFNDLGSAATQEYKALVEWGDASTSRGFAFGLKSFNNDFGGGGTITYWVPTLFLGTGSGSAGNQIFASGSNSQVSIRGDYTTETPWFHLAVTYTRTGGPGAQSRTSFFLNGQLISQRITSPITGLGTAGTINFFRSLRLMSGSTFTTRGKADETLIYKTELTAVEIQSRYNGGYGAAGSSSTANLFEGWHMDVATNPGTYTITAGMSTGGATNLLTTTNGTVGAPGNFGVVFTGGAGSQLRSKYRVENLRLNLRSTSSAIQDEATWSYLYGKIDVRLSYPNTPLLALKITATDQLNSSAPTVTVDGRWRILRVWDGSGFSDQWTNNPAWVALDVLINTRYGRSWPLNDIDLTSFKEWADYCDGFVYDGKGNFQTIDESSGTDPIADLFYDATKFDGYGGFELLFLPGFVPPGSWTVGSFIGFTGLPVDGTVTVDINIGGGVSDGWEIGEIDDNSGGTGYKVWLRYDSATYGTPWGGGGTYSVAATTHVSGSVHGMERRFSYDGAFDTFKPAWDALIEICTTARAVPIKEGNRIRVKYERPRDPVGIICHASIIPGSFTVQYNDRLDSANVVSIDIRDRDQNYERSPVEVFDPELDASALEEEIEREPIRLDGVVRRSQATRHGLFIVAANRLLAKSGSFETGPEALPYEVGDVLRLAHDVMPWGSSGRIATGSTATEIVLDREIVLEPATTYFVSMRINALGQTGSGSSVSDALQNVEVLEAAGTYAAGTSITVDTMAVVPSKDDPYILCVEGEEFLCQIVEIRANEDHSRTIEWVKYDEAIYDVDTLPVDLPAAIIAPLTSAPAGPNTIPGNVDAPLAAEIMRQTADGAWRSEITVSWMHHEDTARFIGSTNLFWRHPLGAWDLAGTVDGSGRSTVLALPDQPSGTELEIAIQPVSRGGARRAPDACHRIPLVVYGVSTQPPAPTNFEAHLEGDLVVYTWTPPDAARGLSYEIRRGGWLLGQLVAEAPPGASRTAPLRAWVSGTAGDPPPLYLRSRDARGQYSAAVVLDDFDPLPDGSTVLEDLSWETYGSTGWYDTGIPPVGAPGVSGLETVTIDGQVALQFSGSNLTGTYTSGGTSYVSKVVKATAERVYVECFAVGEQVPPLTLDDWTLALDDPRAGRRTLEGPLVVLPGEPANCTLKIEWRFMFDGALSDWMAYEPTIAKVEAAEFRFTVTRPNTDYQVRIFRFHNRLTRIPKQRHERTPAQAYSMQRIMQHG